MGESKLEILYEDNHLLAVYKPHGLLTQPSGTDQPSLEDRCKAYIKIRDNKPGNVYLHAVHRLDKHAAGIVLFAKTSKALARLNAAFRSKETKKVYRAIVEGTPSQSEETLEHWLVHDDRKARVSVEGDPKAKRARLHYKVESIDEGNAILRIELETGRYHQIRAQLASIGHPILGDTKYGAVTPYHHDGIALTHIELTIQHPTTKRSLVLSPVI